MEISVNHGDAMVVKINGRIDTVTSAQMDARLKEEVVTESKVIMDFADVEYISSAGLRLLLALKNYYAEKNKEFEIHNINAVVREVFSVTGFKNMLTIK